MKVLSLFDGISCGYQALLNLGITPEVYYASEIDKNAIAVSKFNHPNIVRLGDVRNLKSEQFKDVDLLIGGSPCTNLSFAGKGEGLTSPSLEDYLKLKRDNYEFEGQSYLFWEYVRLLKALNPKFYLLENVRMSEKHRKVIDGVLGKPIFVESANFSGAMRKRFYWTNIDVDVVDTPKKDYYTLATNYNNNKSLVIEDFWNGGVDITDRYLAKKGKTKGQTMGLKCPKGKENESALTWTKALGNTRTLNDKARCLTATGQGISNAGATNIKIEGRYFTLDAITSERLMTLPDNYTEVGINEKEEKYNLSYNQRLKGIGNGWTVDVISHIFENLK